MMKNTENCIAACQVPLRKCPSKIAMASRPPFPMRSTSASSPLPSNAAMLAGKATGPRHPRPRRLARRNREKRSCVQTSCPRRVANVGRAVCPVRRDLRYVPTIRVRSQLYQHPCHRICGLVPALRADGHFSVREGIHHDVVVRDEIQVAYHPSGRPCHPGAVAGALHLESS